MKYLLESLKTSHLTNAEIGDMMSATLIKANSLPPTPDSNTEPLYQKYIPGLTQHYNIFFKAFNRGRESELTPLIFSANNGRGVAMSNLRKVVSLGKTSEIAAEKEAANSISLILKRYKEIESMNYGAETENIQKLLVELTAPAMNTAVTALNLTRYINHLRTANDQFVALHVDRSNTNNLQESFDTRALRRDMELFYKEMCLYIQAMANANNGGVYAQLLSLINGPRKQYADLLARRDAEPQASKNTQVATQVN